MKYLDALIFGACLGLVMAVLLTARPAVRVVQPRPVWQGWN